MNILQILRDASERAASDIFLVGGLPLTYRVGGRQCRIEEGGRMMPEEITALLRELYTFLDRDASVLDRRPAEDDFSFALPGCGRFRVNVLSQRGSLSAVFRCIRFGVPSAAELHIPESVLSVADLTSGLVLVTGPTGSGKTSTLACVLDAINSRHDRTIITMEDPIEIVHSHKKSIVIQREIGTDTENFMTALRASLRESPDVLFLGEIRDAETMEVAMTAAETGQLLFSSLHTMSAADTVDRILDGFPERKQSQMRAQLSRVLRRVICQKLVPAKDGSLIPAFEIMVVTPAIQNLIREGKTYQFNSLIQEGAALGMYSMNASLLRLVKEGTIEAETALAYSEDPGQLRKRLGML